MYECTYVRMYVCMFVCMYVRTCVCMYACMHVCFVMPTQDAILAMKEGEAAAEIDEGSSDEDK